jgi:hypothetical protein
MAFSTNPVVVAANLLLIVWNAIPVTNLTLTPGKSFIEIVRARILRLRGRPEGFKVPRG